MIGVTEIEKVNMRIGAELLRIKLENKLGYSCPWEVDVSHYNFMIVAYEKTHTEDEILDIIIEENLG